MGATAFNEKCLTITSWANTNPAIGAPNPEDIAAAAVYLASLEASYVTGATLNVNGGMAMP